MRNMGRMSHSISKSFERQTSFLQSATVSVLANCSIPLVPNTFQMEYELLDTGVFNDDRYFDVFVEYAKAGPEDILVKITAANRGPEAAELHLLPTLWFRNDWAPWIAESNRSPEKPDLKQITPPVPPLTKGGHRGGDRGRGNALAAG